MNPVAAVLDTSAVLASADGRVAGHALHAAFVHEAYYATAEPNAASALLPPHRVILDLSV